MIVFTNPGYIDLRMITTFGVSVKETKTPIGQFGTGLKYALAVILREKGTIELFVGKPNDVEMLDTKYTFGLSPQEVRGAQFEFVTMTDHRDEKTEVLSFTTQYGKNWEPWQAFRELWSNCMDEGGSVYWVNDDYEDLEAGWDGPPEDSTTFIWSGELAEKVWKERGSILLSARDPFPGELAGPLAKLEGVEVWPSPSRHLYYQGIRVHTFPGENTTSAFTYNLTNRWQLTEDRTLAHVWMVASAIGNAVMQSDQAGIITKLLTTGGWEGSKIEWDQLSSDPSETFLQISVQLHQQDKLSGAAKKLFKRYKENYHSYGVKGPDVVDLSAVELKMLQSGIDRAKSCNVPLEGWAFGAQKDMDEDNRFEINGWSATIYLNVEHLPKGPDFIASSIIQAMATVAYSNQDRDDRRGSGRADELANFILFGRFKNYPVKEPEQAEDGETGWETAPNEPPEEPFIQPPLAPEDEPYV